MWLPVTRSYSFETCPIVQNLPPFITRCHSGQSIAKLRGILKNVSTLFQSMKHKLQLSIIKLPECFLQVPYTSCTSLVDLEEVPAE